LFERFHRVTGASGRTFEGTGIGLALVQELVRLHGGSVGVESEVDRGSIFTVTIPRGSAHLPADRIEVKHTLLSTSLGGGAYAEEALRWLPDPTTDDRRPTTDGYDEDRESRIDDRSPARDDPRSSILDLRSSGVGSQRQGRVLLADDNADMREYV